MRAYRVIDDTGTVFALDFEPRPGGAWVNALGRLPEGTPLPGPGTPCFWQIEQARPGARRLVVAVIVGPRLPRLYEPDWSKAVLMAVLNPEDTPNSVPSFSTAIYRKGKR